MAISYILESGSVMKVHPITILVLLLLSSNISGVVGMIVAVPQPSKS